MLIIAFVAAKNKTKKKDRGLEENEMINLLINSSLMA